MRTFPPDPRDGITKEMEDQDEFNRKQGYAAGVTGEYFRYKHVFHKQPSDKDRDEAIRVGTLIRCDACVAIVESLLQRASSLSEDGIADALEGNVEYERTGDPVTDRMLEHKRGCNKHFKDELIAEGWTLRSCKDVHPDRTDSGPCLWRDVSGGKPSGTAVDSYEVWKECLFYACEQSVSRFTDSLAEHLAVALPRGGNRSEVVRNACETIARCGGGAARRDDGSGSGAARGGLAEGKKRRRRSRRRKAPVEEL